MELKIQHWGNSAAIRINRTLLKQINARVGEVLAVEVRNGGLFLKPVAEPQYSLDELLVSCTKARMQRDDEDQAWLDDTAVGKET